MEYHSVTKEYKGFIGSVIHSSTESIYHGKLLYNTKNTENSNEIEDLVTYEGNLDNIQEMFEEAVDDYIELLNHFKL